MASRQDNLEDLQSHSAVFCTRQVSFDAAHRISGHEHKCRYLHGHRYILEVTITAVKLDSLGRVVDFGQLKERIKGWIDTYFDHNTILAAQDHELGTSINTLTGQQVYYLANPPTAENIALYLKDHILPTLLQDLNCKIVKVKLYETPNCSVEV